MNIKIKKDCTCDANNHTMVNMSGEEFKKLTDYVESLEKEIKISNDALNYAGSMYDGLSEKYDNLEKEKKSSDKAFNDACKMYDRLREKYDNLEKAFEKQVDLNKVLNNNIMDMYNTELIEKLQKENESFERENVMLRNNNETLGNANVKLTETVENLKEFYNILKDDYEDLSNHHKNLLDDFENLKNLYSASLKENESIKERREELKEEFKQLKTVYNSNLEAYNNLERDYNELKNNYEDLADNHDRLVCDFDGLNAKRIDVELENLDLKDQVKAMKAIIDTLLVFKNNYNSLSKDYEVAYSNLEDLKKYVKELEEDKETLTKECSALFKEYFDEFTKNNNTITSLKEILSILTAASNTNK